MPRGLSVEGGILERDDVVHRVGRLLERARGGTGGAVVIVGDCGLGKTTTLEGALASAEGWASVARAWGDPTETLLPRALEEQLLRGLGAETPAHASGTGAASSPTPADHFATVLARVSALCSTGPVVLGCDDLQWADADSLAMLGFLCRRIQGLPLAVVATTRRWPAAAEEMARRLAYRGAAEIVELRPLSEDAAGRLLTDRAGRPLTAEEVTRAHRLCSGNPLLLAQLGASVRERELRLDADLEWAPGHPEFIVLSQFAGLSTAALDLARAASVAGNRFRLDVTVEAAQLRPGDGEGAIEALSRAGLVQPDGPGRWRFVHPLVRDAVHSDLPPHSRSRLDLATVRALRRRGLEAEAAEQVVRGDLVGNREAVSVLELAGRRALRAGRPESAAQHLQAAVQLWLGTPSTALLMALGEALLGGGHPAQAIRAYQQVLAAAGQADEAHARALRMLGRAAAALGQRPRATTLLRDAAILAEADPATQVHALLDLALISWQSHGVGRSREIVVEAEDAARDLRSELAHRRIASTRGFLSALGGDPGGLEVLTESASRMQPDLVPHARELAWSWSGSRLLSDALRAAGRLADAEEIVAAALAEARGVGAWEAVGALALSQADTLTRRGALDQALALTSEAADLTELVPALEPGVEARRAVVLLHLGRLDESAAACTAAERSAEAQEDWLSRLWVWHVRGHRALRAGAYELAAAIYADLERVAAECLQLREPCVVPWARHAIAAALGAGQPERGAAILARLSPRDDPPGCPWAQVAARSGRALLAEQRGDVDSADQLFRSALALEGLADLPLERAEILVDHGSFLRRAGQPVRARAPLAEAAELAERCGAAWLQWIAHEELSVAHGRRRRRGASDGELTPQERRVHDLAAAGCTNDQIARRLSISPRTVGAHLEKVYAKLAVQGRRELMLMALQAPAEEPRVISG